MTKEEKGLEFPINQKLLEEATRAMEEWRVIRARLQKIEEHKSGVSPNVYERVKKDYVEKHAKSTEALVEKKEDIDKELKALGDTRSRIEGELKTHRHNLEEIKFRNTLGEYDEGDYQEKSRVEQEKTSKFETVLNAVDSNIHRYKSIFEGEEIFADEDKHAPEEEISEPHENTGRTPLIADTEPKVDGEGFVVCEGEDYFSPSHAESTSPGVEESATQKVHATQGRKKMDESESLKPRLVIISGENSGSAFLVKGTVTIGRADSCTVSLKDAKASRQHAKIEKQGSEYILIDLNSSNGTEANGEKVEEHVLSNGDEIQIGDTIIQFQSES